MRAILERIKAGTVPHDMLEELFESDVRFYDGANNLISTLLFQEKMADLLRSGFPVVQIHDHRSTSTKDSTASIT